MANPRVILGPLRHDDSAILWQWINDRELVLLSSPYRPVHLGTHEDWFARIQQQKDTVIFAIRTEDRLIGTCQLHSIHPVHRSAEFQIRIGDPASRGKGFGSQALAQMLAFGFHDLNLHRIYLHVFADNTPAQRLYLRHGFQREGTLRSAIFLDGKYVDVVLMSLLRAEYEAAGSRTPA